MSWNTEGGPRLQTFEIDTAFAVHRITVRRCIARTVNLQQRQREESSDADGECPSFVSVTTSYSRRRDAAAGQRSALKEARAAIRHSTGCH